MKLLTAAASAFLFALSSATSCNPLVYVCEPDKALATSFKENFSSKSDYFTEIYASQLTYSSDGLKMEIAKQFDNPSIKSNFYIMFGKVEVVMKAASGQGIVSSFYLQSDDLDEIDLEFIGGDPLQFQSNYFSKGNTTTWDRGQYHQSSDAVTTEFHTYTIEMTSDVITWSMNGNVVRTLTPATSEGFPQTPMYIMAGAWAGGDSSNQPGVIEWAGGATDYSKGPFDMYIKSIIVSDYSTGTGYEYTDKTGSWTSIKAVDGEINGRESEAQAEFQKLQKNVALSSSTSVSTSSESSSSLSSSISSSSYDSSSSSSALNSSASSSTSAAHTSSSSGHVIITALLAPLSSANSSSTQAASNSSVVSTTSSTSSSSSHISSHDVRNSGAKFGSGLLLLLSLLTLI